MIQMLARTLPFVLLLVSCTDKPSTVQSNNAVNNNGQPTTVASQNSSPQSTSNNNDDVKKVTNHYAHLKPEHRDVLVAWLKSKPYLRPAVEEIDNEMFSDVSTDREANIKFLRDTIGAESYQYYSVGDMSHDGNEDFAVLLVDTRKHTAEYDRFELAIFNAPFKSGMAPVYYEKELTDISNCYIDFNKSSKGYLYLGKLESDAICATYYPKGKTYVFKDCMD